MYCFNTDLIRMVGKETGIKILGKSGLCADGDTNSAHLFYAIKDAHSPGTLPTLGLPFPVPEATLSCSWKKVMSGLQVIGSGLKTDTAGSCSKENICWWPFGPEYI